MPATNLKAALQSIPDNAPEAVVAGLFADYFIEELGFQKDEIHREFPTGGGLAVDYAARKNTKDDCFVSTRSNPYLLMEIKGRDVDLSENSTTYKKTVNQLKGYLLGANCKAAQWGIITNSTHVQLFRKHGKVIHPATLCFRLDSDNINDITELLKRKIQASAKALSVAIYNNKGGVGKTTTTINLAAILSLFNKRVLIVDFDPSQQDLTSSIGISISEGDVYEALINKNADIRSAMKLYSFRHKQTGKEFGFDVIPVDRKLVEIDEIDIRKKLKPHSLYQKLESLKTDYDYILIDSPPNWRFYSQQAVYAADVVLIPTKHNNLFSLENAATTIMQFIPETQAERRDGGPIALPIFFNGEKTTPSQLEIAQKEIGNLINQANKSNKFDLLKYFYPRYSSGRNCHIFEIPNYAQISSAAFSRIPAVYCNKTAAEYYLALAKEYFLQ